MTELDLLRQLAKSQLENFDWETNPDWQTQYKKIWHSINNYHIQLKLEQPSRG